MPLPYAGLRRGLAAAAVLFALPASAQQLPTDQIRTGFEPSSDAYRAPVTNPLRPTTGNARRAAGDLYEKGGPMARFESTLRLLAMDYEARAQRGARLGAEFVQIEALATSPADVAALRSSLVALGFEPTGQASAVVSGRLPVSAIEAAATIPTLRSAFAPHHLLHGRSGSTHVSPVLARSSRVGAVDGEASLALRADIARERFGVTGAGVCIGVLSDSYDNCADLNADDDPDNDCVTTAAEDVASGDIPAGVEVLEDLDPFTDPPRDPGSDEGRAMMQLAYDVAPGVDFKFHTAFGGSSGFSGGIIELFQAGCQVVVDDVSNSFEPFFQDGIIAQAADYVADQGGVYFSSAGNSADASYESDYRGSGVQGTFEKTFIGELHDFDPSSAVDPYQNVTLAPGQVLRFAFQFDEPSILAGTAFSEFPELIGGENNVPESDYDVVVLDRPSNEALILAQSLNSNPSFGAPVEFIEYVNTTGAAQTVYVAVGKFEGEDRRFKYINFGGTRSVIQAGEYVVPGTSTTFGHSNAAGAFATGAGFWFNAVPYNGFVDTIESAIGPAVVNSFSSFGGLDIRLDTDGNRLAAPDVRSKPDAVSTDADNNTFFGGDFGADADALPNFAGTSAAAPNAAAVAALALEASPDASTDDVYRAFEATAADLRASNVTSANGATAPGFDNRSGNGIVRADFALGRLTGAEPVACSRAVRLSFDFNGDGAVTGADYEIDGTNDPGEFLGGVFGELAAVSNDTATEFVDLSSCSFVAFSPFSERVTYSTPLSGVIGAREELVLSAARGNQTIPFGSLPDGPGAFALIEGSAAVGARVRDVLGSVVASVVYRDDQNVVGSRSGGASAARRAGDADQEFLDALAAVRGDALAAGSVDLTLTATPNPVRGRLAVAFGTEGGVPVRASVYDVLGREVAVLADHAFEAGRHEMALDTAAMPSGVYVVRVVAGDAVQTKQVTVVR